MTTNPYSDLPPQAFWRSGVAEQAGAVPEALYTRKWPIDRTTRIATAGSCFAQHIGRTLRHEGFDVLDVEPPPATLPAARRMDYSYGIYSARYGNIYTVRQLLQLAREAFGETPQVTEVWTRGAGHVDALRPTLEPAGFASPEAVHAHRARHLERVRQLFLEADLLVFTLGLTEAWENRKTGLVYPLCPGTVAGRFDLDLHAFHNFTYPEIVADFEAFRALLTERRGGQSPLILLTVSPVPLTATMSGRHVQVATVHSKSVLRAAAGDLAQSSERIDYFPSYEIVTSPWSGDRLYEPNLRSVSAAGVARVMRTFLAAQGVAPAEAGAGAANIAARDPAAPAALTVPAGTIPATDEDRTTAEDRATEEDRAMLTKCDEELLDAFGKPS